MQAILVWLKKDPLGRFWCDKTTLPGSLFVPFVNTVHINQDNDIYIQPQPTHHTTIPRGGQKRPRASDYFDDSLLTHTKG